MLPSACLSCTRRNVLAREPFANLSPRPRKSMFAFLTPLVKPNVFKMVVALTPCRALSRYVLFMNMMYLFLHEINESNNVLTSLSLIHSLQTMVTEKRTITCTRMETECVDYEYEVSICKMEQSTKQVKVCRYECDTVEKSYEVTICKMEPSKKTIKVAQYTRVCGGCHNTCC